MNGNFQQSRRSYVDLEWCKYCIVGSDDKVDRAIACKGDQAAACNAEFVYHADQCVGAKHNAREKRVTNSTRAKMMNETKENTEAGAREEPINELTRAAAVSELKVPAKVEDHDCTWRDVLLNGMKKKETLQSLF